MQLRCLLRRPQSEIDVSLGTLGPNQRKDGLERRSWLHVQQQARARATDGVQSFTERWDMFACPNVISVRFTKKTRPIAIISRS